MTAANWPTIATYLDGDEGGYVFNKRDPGGATNHGITARVLAAWRHVRSVTPFQVKALSLKEAQQILKAQYFDAVHGDQLPAGLDYSVVDAAVNSGPVQAAKWLQRALKVKADGHIGVVTLQAVVAHNDISALIANYNAQRLGFMRHLPTWIPFGKGWRARVSRVDARSIQLAKRPVMV